MTSRDETSSDETSSNETSGVLTIETNVLKNKLSTLIHIKKNKHLKWKK